MTTGGQYEGPSPHASSTVTRTSFRLALVSAHADGDTSKCQNRIQEDACWLLSFSTETRGG
jgi:hypothetical protein